MAQQKAEAAAFARGERKPPRRREVGDRAILGKLRQHRGDGAGFQRLLLRPQHVDRARDPQDHQPLHGKPKQVKAGAVEHSSFEGGEIGLHPQNRRLAPGQGGER